MSLLTVKDNCIVVAKGLNIDVYHNSQHNEFSVTSTAQENDVISDVTISANGKYLAIITSTSKQLLIYDLPVSGKHKSYRLPRSASKIRFTSDAEQILVADKSGDVLLYKLKEEDSGTKLLGHLSLLLDVLQTADGQYIISCDRDEKIRVSRYPNTYNIETFCLGHKEFVNHIELLPHNPSYLTSASGDGHIKCWDFISGKEHYSIDTYQDINDSSLKEDFIKAMDLEIVQVEALPIVHYTAAKMDESSSLVAVTVYSYDKILLYKLNSEGAKFTHELIYRLDLERFPTSVALHDLSLFIYDCKDNSVTIYKIVNEDKLINVKFENRIEMFKNGSLNLESNVKYFESIKVLYKRKFDNVQEYQERKRQRLEKSEKGNK